MGKKVKEYKAGDFIFAKVKGYPAWPARVQKMNGKKYFVYFYGTGETANLPPNMIFDYAENKNKFLSKSVKRRDFNDGVKQIEHDFANNVPLEDVIGVPMEMPADTTANDSAIDVSGTLDDTLPDTADAADTADETVNTTQNDTTVEDSDESGALVIDEPKQATKGKKSKPEAKTPATPKGKEPKTPRGKPKKDDTKEDEKATDGEEKKDEELVSRSGRKIRPKRYVDEQTDENSTLPSPAPKKRRATSPEKEKSDKDKNIKHFNAVTQSELEDLKEPFKSEDPEKDNILIAYLPTSTYVGIKLFTGRPSSFKNEASRLQWDKQAASNAITLKMQLERGQITPQSIQAQLVMDLNLTDEEKATLDKERETEEKKSRVQFLKTEMKLIELDAKIKTCLCLEKADTDMCLKLLDELMELDVKPLMLLKHPTCLETVKRMRAYVGNTPSWDLSEHDALAFSKQAHKIRKQADTLYRSMKELFITPEGLSFWEYFSERVILFKKATTKLTPNELLEMVHEPLELNQPSLVTMKSAIDAAFEEDLPLNDEPLKKKSTSSKSKKPATPKNKRGKKQTEEKTDKKNEQEQNKEDAADKNDKEVDSVAEKEVSSDNQPTEQATPETNDIEMAEPEQNKTNSEQEKQTDKTQEQTEPEKPQEEPKNSTEELENNKEPDNDTNDKTENVEGENKNKESNGDKDANEKDKDEIKDGKDKEKDKADEKDKQDEPRAKRTRENKKTEAPPPRSPAKRKSKA